MVCKRSLCGRVPGYWGRYCAAYISDRADGVLLLQPRESERGSAIYAWEAVCGNREQMLRSRARRWI